MLTKSYLIKLKKLMDQVEEDVSDLVYFHRVYTILNEEIKRAQWKEGNPLLYLLGNSYFSSAVMAVNRQYDSGQKDISLMRILKSIAAHKDDMDKDWFIKQYNGKIMIDGKDILISAAESDWKDNFASNSFPSGDIKNFDTIMSNVKLLRNKRIAHRDAKYKYSFNITLKELSGIVDLIDKLTVKCSLFIKQTGSPDNTMFPGNITDEEIKNQIYKILKL